MRGGGAAREGRGVRKSGSDRRRRARLGLPRPLPGCRFSVPAARAWPVRGGLEKRSLPALLDRGDRCQYLAIRRFLSSADERGPSLSKVHQLLGILPEATEMVGLRHVQKRARNRETDRNQGATSHLRKFTWDLSVSACALVLTFDLEPKPRMRIVISRDIYLRPKTYRVPRT